jgi:FtsZ-binding cell division protein ZapB
MAILLMQIDTLKENSARLELELAAMKQRQEDVQQEQSKRLEDANNQCKDSLQLQLQAVESHRMASDKWHLDERTYSNTIELLQKQIADLQATISATPDIQDLHNQISALANENQAMKRHAAGALDRLNTSTLDEHERGLVKKVYDSTVESHKMEIAEKNNEISRVRHVYNTKISSIAPSEIAEFKSSKGLSKR